VLLYALTHTVSISKELFYFSNSHLTVEEEDAEEDDDDEDNEIHTVVYFWQV